MAKKTAPLLPATEARLQQLGERLRLARLRRRLTGKQVAERAGMTPVTLRSLERGGSGVTMGAYLAVMQVLGAERDLDLVLKDDPLGRDLQDSALTRRSRGTGQAAPAAPKHRTPSSTRPSKTREAKAREVAAPTPWVADEAFVSVDGLASLIKSAGSNVPSKASKANKANKANKRGPSK